jgi:hypothetical protein
MEVKLHTLSKCWIDILVAGQALSVAPESLKEVTNDTSVVSLHGCQHNKLQINQYHCTMISLLFCISCMLRSNFDTNVNTVILVCLSGICCADRDVVIHNKTHTINILCLWQSLQAFNTNSYECVLSAYHCIRSEMSNSNSLLSYRYHTEI